MTQKYVSIFFQKSLLHPWYHNVIPPLSRKCFREADDRNHKESTPLATTSSDRQERATHSGWRGFSFTAASFVPMHTFRVRTQVMILTQA